MAARLTIQSYRKFAAYFAPFDHATLNLFEHIVAGEEACANELVDVLDETSNVLAT